MLSDILQRFVLAALLFAAAIPPSLADGTSAFSRLEGRWTGEGRLGVKDSPPETVKCRATYLKGETADDLKQTIRCATAGGAIEVVSNVHHAGGQLKGHWKETMHNIEGDLEGTVTPKGFRIQVKGGELAANMDIIAQDDRQIVEIQFFNSALTGLTLVLRKG